MTATPISVDHHPRPGAQTAVAWVRGHLAVLTLALVTVAFMFPFFWVLGHSLETNREFNKGAVTLWPSHLTLHNYATVITRDGFLRNVVDSIVVAAMTTVITLVLSSLAGYALARLPIRARGVIFGFVILVGFFPILAMLGPLFLVYRQVGLLNSLPGVSIADLIYTLPLCTWLLASLFSQLPAEVEEAAMVDGCGRLGALWRVVLPLAAPAMATAAIFSFILAWSDFAFSLTFLSSASRYTAPLAILANSQNKYITNFNLLDAMVILTALPIFALVLLAQRRIVTGLTAGAVK